VGSSVSVSVSVSDSALRTLASETATRSPIARSDKPCSRRTAIVAITSGVSLEARRGPLRCGTSALTPAADSACAQRQTVNGEVSNAAATCTWVAALIRINDTAANRRPAVSPASQAKDRFPCTKTRPPSSSSIIAAAAPISVAPVGISGKGGWVVITVIVARHHPPETLHVLYRG